MDETVYRGRYRMEDDKLVLEWRGGREALSCGLVRPDVVAEQWLRVNAADGDHGAA